MRAGMFVLHFLNNQRYKPGMRKTLKLHPDSLCMAAAQIDVEVARPHPGCLALRYIVTGNMSELCLPPARAPKRSGELWRHTCFEAFIRALPGEAYTEFNFAPSRQWAAYGFNGYRSGMRIAEEISAPQLAVTMNSEGCELNVSLALNDLIDLPGDAPWDIGLSAVLEEKSGGKSCWALAHPPGKPDFHHADCFALQIPSALRS